MDIFLLAVLVVSGISGAKKGFMLTVKSFLGWFLSLIPALIFCSTVKSFLISETDLTSSLCRVIHVQFPADYLPDAAMPWLKAALAEVESETELALVSMLISVISFLIIIILSKVIISVFVMIFSKKHHDGATGFIDSIMGFGAGILRGLFYVLLIFILFIPLFSLWMPDLGTAVSEAAADSLIAGAFYNHNILLTVLEIFSDF